MFERTHNLNYRLWQHFFIMDWIIRARVAKSAQ